MGLLNTLLPGNAALSDSLLIIAPMLVGWPYLGHCQPDHIYIKIGYKSRYSFAFAWLLNDGKH